MLLKLTFKASDSAVYYIGTDCKKLRPKVVRREWKGDYIGGEKEKDTGPSSGKRSIHIAFNQVACAFICFCNFIPRTMWHNLNGYYLPCFVNEEFKTHGWMPTQINQIKIRTQFFLLHFVHSKHYRRKWYCIQLITCSQAIFLKALKKSCQFVHCQQNHAL